VPITTIQAAISGDTDAINNIVDHYNRLILKLSIKKMYDEYGNPHDCVDEYTYLRLRTKLIAKIVKFKFR
jgi:hypothetical protein